MATDSVKGTLGVAAALCVVCSVLVSGMAIGLKPKQEENKILDIKKNILLSAGLLTNTSATKNEILSKYKSIKEIVINLKSGEIDSSVDAKSFDAKAVAKNPKLRYSIPNDKDLARIKVRAPQSKVFLVQGDSGIESLIFPVHGKGLWSTLYGFITLGAEDLKVKGFGFYQHGETPGLGGEVDNPTWKASWVGKVVLNSSLSPIIKIVKGGATGESEVDALSGATITSNGVEALVKYWLGEDGFGPFLENYKNGGVQL